MLGGLADVSDIVMVFYLGAGEKGGGVGGDAMCGGGGAQGRQARRPKCNPVQFKWPGIEWKTGRNPKIGKIVRKIEHGPWPEMGKKWPKNGEKNGFLFPHFGSRGIFFFSANFFLFSISARFPFYSRPPDL